MSSNEPASIGAPRPPSRALRWGSLVLWLAMQLPMPGALKPGDSARSHLPSEAAFWLMAVVLVIWVVRVERRPLSSIGMVRPTWRSLAWGAAAAFVMVAGLAVIYAVVLPALPADGQSTMGHIASVPKWLSLLIVVRAAVFEELCYRGFAIERLGEIFGSGRLAALVSLAAFTLVHLYGWNWSHLVVVLYAGFVLTALYLWRRDLVANMVAHFLTDITGVLLS
jgi:membrane protease YdiL (CAAX protease family)